MTMHRHTEGIASISRKMWQHKDDRLPSNPHCFPALLMSWIRTFYLVTWKLQLANRFKNMTCVQSQSMWMYSNLTTGLGTWHGKPPVRPETSAQSCCEGSNVMMSSYMGHCGRCPSACRACRMDLQKGFFSTSAHGPPSCMNVVCIEKTGWNSNLNLLYCNQS